MTWMTRSGHRPPRSLPIDAPNVRLWHFWCLAPDRASQLDCPTQLGAFVCFGDRIPDSGAREAALRAHREPVEVDIAPGLIDSALQHVQVFEFGHFAADQPE